MQTDILFWKFRNTTNWLITFLPFWDAPLKHWNVSFATGRNKFIRVQRLNYQRVWDHFLFQKIQNKMSKQILTDKYQDVDKNKRHKSAIHCQQLRLMKLNSSSILKKTNIYFMYFIRGLICGQYLWRLKMCCTTVDHQSLDSLFTVSPPSPLIKPQLPLPIILVRSHNLNITPNQQMLYLNRTAYLLDLNTVYYWWL